MLKQLKRIVYPVTDLPAAKAWYTDILGFAPLFDSPRAVIFTVGHCSLSLVVVPEVTDNGSDSHSSEVYWEVDDVETALDVLLKKGARLLSPISEVFKIRTTKVADPFGNILGLTDQGAKAEQKPVEQKPSESAYTVAFCRALAACDERQELKGHDSLATLFLEPKAKALLETADQRKWAIANLATSPLYGYFLARTAYLDHLFVEACRQSLPQIVFLGAGYDTRAIRFREKITTTQVFELDVPTTQNLKITKLKAAGISDQPSLTYVPVNFEKANLLDVLQRAGYDPEAKTLFIWEGVSYYLTQSSVTTTLQFLKDHVAAGSILALDLMVQKVQSVHAGEPFLFWMPPAEFSNWLAGFGLDVTEMLDAPELTRRYLTTADGLPGEGCLSSFVLIKAEKQ